MKKICGLISLIFIVMLLSRCDFNNTPYILRNTLSEGDFIYNINTDGSNTAIILGFTNEGLEKEYLIVPSTIGGYPVRNFNQDLAFTPLAKMENTNLKKIYFQYEITIGEHAFQNVSNLEKIIIMKASVRYNHSKALYAHIDGTFSSWYANVTYISNEEIYWVDDYDYGTTITIVPPNPTRDGYNFVGWYKEQDCINLWDFENDKLPILEDEEYYKETRIFAKWEEIAK